MIRTGLYRQMDKLTEVRMTTDSFQRLIRHILGVTGGKTNTHIRNGISHYLQQVCEIYCRTILAGEAIGVYILSQ